MVALRRRATVEHSESSANAALPFLSAATSFLSVAERVPFLRLEPSWCRSLGCNVALDGFSVRG